MQRIVCGALLVAAGGLATLGVAQEARRPDAQAKPPKPPTLQPLATFPDQPDVVYCVAFAPDGRTLAAGTYRAVKLFDSVDKKETASLPLDTGFVKSLAFSPDGRWLVAGSYQRITVFDAASKSVAATLKGHRGYVTGLSFSRDGTRLASCSVDETARLWTVPAVGTEAAASENPGWAEQFVLRGHKFPIAAIAFSPDGTQVATAAGDDAVLSKPGESKLWDAATGTEKLELPPHGMAATSVAFLPNGRTLLTGGFDEFVLLIDTATGKEAGTFEEHPRPVTSIAVTAGGRLAASGCGGRFKGKNGVLLWQPTDGKVLAQLPEFPGPVTGVAFNAAGTLLATSSQDRVVALWDVSAYGGSPPAPPPPAASPAAAAVAPADDANKELRVGIIGLDTSHATAFTAILNDKDAKEDVARCRVVAAYPQGSKDIVSSTSRVPGYTKEVQERGVEIVDSIDALLEKVDVVLLESNDGRPHLEQYLPVLKAKKRCFIDKPVAGSLTDAVLIYELAAEQGVPVFSSSSLRYAAGAQALRQGKAGKVLGCDAYSPCALEPTHPDLFWYGIHGVETLFTVMGPGCTTVTRASVPGFDVATGTWGDGRIGTFRGIRAGASGYGGTAYCEKGIEPVGPYDGYRPLLVEIVKFFRTGVAPVSAEETIEIYAFMEAADESKRQGGAPVKLSDVLHKARDEAKIRRAGLPAPFGTGGK